MKMDENQKKPQPAEPVVIQQDLLSEITKMEKWWKFNFQPTTDNWAQCGS